MPGKASDFLKDNPVFWSRLGFCYDPPLKNEQGRPLVFCEDLDRYAKFLRAFSKAGVKLHTSILHAGWVGVDEYDYSLTDRVLDAVFRDNEDAYYIPRIKLNPPVDWCRENPEDVFVYYEGPRGKEDIRALVGTPRQDYLGYEAPDGYYCSNDYKDPRPNVGGLISLQSFSSKKWLHDAGAALERLIDRLEHGKYADRILGYHIAYGACGESVLWGRTSNHYGDYGITNRREFFRWGVRKYGSAEAAGQAWGQPGATEDSLVLPSPEERYGRTDDLAAFLRGRPCDRICTDLDLFLSDVNAGAVLHFAEIAKRTGKLVGAFYGYFMFIDNAGYTGHLALDRLLDSPYLDFLAAPKSYYRCTIGEPGGEMCAVQSVNRKKLWLDELDNRTYLSLEKRADWYSRDAAETKAVMLREFAKDLAHDSGFWWMDLGGGWYDAPELMEEVHRLAGLNTALRRFPHESRADVLIVVDERSAYYMRVSADLRCGFMQHFEFETRMSGVLCDTYRPGDLETLDLSPYRLVVFAYGEYMEEDWFRRVRARMRPDAALLFHYAAGAHGRNGFDLKNCERITGYALEPDDRPWEYDFPPVRIREKTGGDEHTLLSVRPYMRREGIREIARQAGCVIRTEQPDTVLYGDNRFLAVFNNKGAQVEAILPEKGDYIDAVTGRRYENTARAVLDMSGQNAAFLVRADILENSPEEN